ncbi:cadherin EGF LAG seven-pass G-type receptor fmi-1-like isoform X2 [Mya arenaria]|uniref:cadherin EGF LAG seven-pass G-type receptor fmi-1-like isoform X2 n=1 Tax=Mya arenaria TaxID=6604 RepID=UPI0022E4A9D4|nr:cadherin EGF LAG seven-pass G-type receptor fmi-1-like isoform X2 [Mya arenaria]
MNIIQKIVFGFTVFLTVCDIASSGPPPSYSAQSYVTVDETVQINTALFTFNVTDDGASISVEPADDTTRRFVTVHVSGGPSPWTVTVRNSIPLDKDIATGGQSSIGLRFSLSDADGNTIVTRITTLYLTDVNDNAPVFLNKPYTWYIYEKPYNTSTFYKINATDFDSNRNGRISYFMQSQHTASEYLDAFSIDIVSGMVHLQKPLDYETNNFYQFTITAMDGGSPPLTTTTDLIISVRDVQDTAPFFTGGPYHAEVQEEVPRGTYVLRVNAVDGDTGSPNNIIYTMLNNTGDICGNMFTIDHDTGMFATSSFIDRDSGIIKNNSGFCRFTVLATENGSTSITQYGNTSITTDVIIKVLDINDNAPIFSQKFYTAYIPDNSSPGSAITVANEIIVKDNDEGDNAMMNITLTYADTGYPCQDFYVDQTTIFGEGSIWIRMSNHANMSDLRFSKTKQIVLWITATGPPPLQFESSALLNITITPGGTYLCNGGHTQNVAVSSTFPINTTPITTSPLPVPGNGEQQIVSLNVGGSVFQTSLATIQRVPANSVLMATPSFIDRDPTHFRVILDYLRDKGSFDAGRLPSHILDLHEIIAEAMYYQLDELAHICTTKLTAMIA